MRIATNMGTRLFMEMIRISNAQKASKTAVSNSLDTITISSSAKELYKASKNSRTSSNREVDNSINLQSYIDKAKEKNAETIKDVGDKITAQNSYVNEGDACYQALKDKYARLLDVAKSHSNPKGYIQDKYCNKDSPYYVSDLMDEERDVAYSNEIQMLSSGNINGCDMRDSLFRGITINGVDEDENDKIFKRQVVNSEINNLFKENGIEVLKDTQLSFSINPYSYDLTVSGIEDKELKEKIKDVLNSVDNSKELYLHIALSSQSNVTKSTQLTKDGFRKYNLYHEALDVTGFDIRSLTEKDGSYYTEHGEDIVDIFNTQIDEMAKNGNSYVPKQYTAQCKEYFASMVHEISAKGLDNIPDMKLSIDYSDNELQDVYQNTNYSKGDIQYKTYKYSKSSFNTLP